MFKYSNDAFVVPHFWYQCSAFARLRRPMAVDPATGTHGEAPRSY